LFDAITMFLVRAADTRPLVLILDDLHWADKPSLLLLRFLAREMGGSRLLVVATYRDVEVSRGHPLAEVLPSLRQERTVERLLLRGLPEEDVRAMLVALRGENVPDTLARAISHETTGEQPRGRGQSVLRPGDRAAPGRRGGPRRRRGAVDEPVAPRGPASAGKRARRDRPAARPPERGVHEAPDGSLGRGPGVRP